MNRAVFLNLMLTALLVGGGLTAWRLPGSWERYSRYHSRHPFTAQVEPMMVLGRGHTRSVYAGESFRTTLQLSAPGKIQHTVCFEDMPLARVEEDGTVFMLDPDFPTQFSGLKCSGRRLEGTIHPAARNGRVEIKHRIRDPQGGPTLLRATVFSIDPRGRPR